MPMSPHIYLQLNRSGLLTSLHVDSTTPSGMPNNYVHACVNACVHDMVWDACLLGQHVKKCMAIFQ